MQAASSAATTAAAAMDEQPGAPLDASQPQHTHALSTIEQIEGKVHEQQQEEEEEEAERTRSSSLASDDDDHDSLSQSCDEGEPAIPSDASVAARAAARARDPEWSELQSLVHKVSLLQQQSDHLAQLSSLQKQMIEKHAYRPPSSANRQQAASGAASSSSVSASSSRASAVSDLSRNPFEPIQLSPINPYLHPQYAPLDELKTAPIPLRMQEHSAEAASSVAASAAAAAAPAYATPPRSWTGSPHSNCRSVSSSAGASTAASPVPIPSGSPEPSRIRSQWEMRRSRGTHDDSQGPACSSPHLLSLADVQHSSSFLADSDEHKDDGAFDDESRSSTHRSPRRAGHHTVSVSGDEDDRASVTFSHYAYSGRGPPSVIGSVSSSLYAHHAPSLITSTVRSGSPSTVSVARSVGARSINGGPSVDGDGVDSHANSEQLEDFEEESTLLAEIDEDDARTSSSDTTDERSERRSQASSSAAAARAESRAATAAASAATARFVASSPPLTASSLAHLNRPSSRSLKAKLRMREQLQHIHQQASQHVDADERDERVDGGSSSELAPLPVRVPATNAGVPVAASSASVSASLAASAPRPLTDASAAPSATAPMATSRRQHQLGSMGQALFATLMQQMQDRRQTQ